MRPWPAALLLLTLGLSVGANAVGEQIFSDGSEGGLDCALSPPANNIVNVRSSLVQPVFRLNGGPFPAIPAQSARFFLVPREGGWIELGSSDATAPQVRVLDGVYDVMYRWHAGTQVPRNFDARVMQNVLVAGDRQLLIDVPSTLLQGNLTMNGAPFPQLGPAGGFLSLRSVYGLGGLPLASTNASNYTVRLIPGSYRLRYAAPGTPSAIPANQSALLDRINIEPASTVQRHFDIPAVITQFVFRVDGLPPPSSALEYGKLSLRTADGDRVDLAESRSQALTLRLIPGRYDAWWEWMAGSQVPANADSMFAPGVDIAAGIVFLDVPSREFAGDFLVNGAAAPGMIVESGKVWMRDPHSGADVFLGGTDFGLFNRRLIPGVYDLLYSVVSGSGIVPANNEVAFERGRLVTALPAADVDVPSVLLAWNLTLNGGPFPADVIESGRIAVRSPDDLQSVDLGSTDFLGGAQGQGSVRRLVPGSYRPSYSLFSGSSFVPANSNATLDDTFEVVAGGGPMQTIDVRVGLWNFLFRNNGVAFAVDPARRASFALRHRDDSVFWGTTDLPSGPRRLISNVLPLDDGRTATVHYTWLAGGPAEMPRNVDTPVSCHVLLPH